MRDILGDLDGPFVSDANPMKRAQLNMRAPLPKRFYKDVTVALVEGGHAVLIDGKPAKTPGRNPLVLPTEAAAAMVAAEYDAQVDVVDPVTMPVTRLANTAIDGVAQDPQAVLEDMLRFASTDLVCYRADAPERLVARQAETWDPVLDWIQSRYGARFVLAEGVMHVAQPREAIAILGASLATRAEPFRLATVHVMTTLMGSALLALAVEGEGLTADEAWRAAHLDEDWNIELWGEDAEAMARRTARAVDFNASAKLLSAL